RVFQALVVRGAGLAIAVRNAGAALADTLAALLVTGAAAAGSAFINRRLLAGAVDACGSKTLIAFATVGARWWRRWRRRSAPSGDDQTETGVGDNLGAVFAHARGSAGDELFQIVVVAEGLGHSSGGQAVGIGQFHTNRRIEFDARRLHRPHQRRRAGS